MNRVWHHVYIVYILPPWSIASFSCHRRAFADQFASRTVINSVDVRRKRGPTVTIVSLAIRNVNSRFIHGGVGRWRFSVFFHGVHCLPQSGSLRGSWTITLCWYRGAARTLCGKCHCVSYYYYYLLLFIMKSYTRYAKITGKSKILSIQRPSNIIRSTSKSRPNNIGRKMSVRPYVRTSVRPQKVSSIWMKFGI